MKILARAKNWHSCAIAIHEFENEVRTSFSIQEFNACDFIILYFVLVACINPGQPIVIYINCDAVSPGILVNSNW